MRCEEVRELLPEYVDAELHEAGEVELHLASCEDCTALLASYASMLAELEGLPETDPAVPAALIERVLSQIPERSVADRIRGSVREHKAVYVAGIGGAAIVAAVVALALRRSRTQRVNGTLAPEAVSA